MTDTPTTTRLIALRDRLASTRYADRPRLARELDRLFARRAPHDAAGDKAYAALEGAIETSCATVERLRTVPLRFEFDDILPISAHREDIVKALAMHQLIVVCGATGSGKTTQLPKICLAAGRGAFGMIGHTQPRRIAARAIADRLASELGTNVGGAVGYQVRFNDRTGPDCRVKLMTDGILLRELEHDRLLRRYDTLIIDEAHERSLNVDFLLGVLKGVLPQRPELKVIITSATIDPQRFAGFFGGAPVLEVSGRSYPVEIRYRSLAGDEEEEELTLPEGVVAAIRELDQEARGMNGDVLVFLPGEKQIRDAADAIGKARLPHTEVLPLYARLSTRDQERIFERHTERRVILATNVAETSLTVPGIRYVIDSGLARISRYSVRGKVQRLPIEPISQASAQQRSGRCGRESAGICVRLYAEEDFAAREPFTPPEVLRTNLASVILQMAALELGDPEAFPFLDPPDTRQINDGYRLLQELKACDDTRRVTSLGRQVASLPVDPRLARMLLAASHHGCLTEMLIIAAFLAGQDPRERPAEAQAKADASHAAFADPRSDFMAVLNLWRTFGERSEALSGSQLRKWARENFLSYLRLREWQELHRQLSETVRELELRPNQVPASYADLHQAILTGFLGNIGTLDEKREYEGARGSRFVIAPGTPLTSKPPGWVVAASLIETTRLYARMVAAIEPPWIEAAGAHLLKRTYSEPHWVENRGFVAALETTSLYGLTLSAQRRVNYGSVAPREAREIFVREALVEGRSHLRAQFLEQNRTLRRQVEALEAKVRRRDILVDEQTMCDFYLARLPDHIHSSTALERWLKGADAKSPPVAGKGAVPPPPTALCMSLPDLMRRDTVEIDATNYPDSLNINDNTLPIEYRFEPGAADDGATLVVPLPLLNTLTAGALSWLIPGWRLEKITALLRALPKNLRKAFVPVPEHALRAMTELQTSDEFDAAMALWTTQQGGAVVTAADIASLTLPDHLRFNIRVIDTQGATVATGRDLAASKRAARARGPDTAVPGALVSYRRWEFGEVPTQRTVERRGLRFTVYPTLRDLGDSVQLAEASDPHEAMNSLRTGVLRLALLALPEQLKYAKKRLADNRELVLLSQGVERPRPLSESLAERCFAECFLPHGEPVPRTAEEFQACLDRHRGEFGNLVDGIVVQVVDVLREWRTVRLRLAELSTPAFRTLTDDVRQQLSVLLPNSFPMNVPDTLWPHLPRYLKALVRRLDRVQGNLPRDAELAGRIAPFVREWQRLATHPERPTSHPELDRLQWMIEEFRVSLFAQDLRTAIPVSDKRLLEQLERSRAEARAA